MKKKLLITAILTLCISAFTFAQVEKGNWFFGGSGSLDFNSSNEKVKTGGTTTDGSKYTDFDFRPQVAYFVIDKLPVGLSLDLDIDKEKFTDPDGEYKWTSFMVGPFVRYYITDFDGIMPYAEAAAGFGSGNNKYTYGGDTSDDKYGMFAFRMGAGATYFVTENVGVDLFVGYANYQEKYTVDEDVARSESDEVIYKYGGLDFKIGFVISLGN
ncbi:MAG: outer membrane protein [Lentimicrobium sp.]